MANYENYTGRIKQEKKAAAPGRYVYTPPSNAEKEKQWEQESLERQRAERVEAAPAVNRNPVAPPPVQEPAYKYTPPTTPSIYDREEKYGLAPNIPKPTSDLTYEYYWAPMPKTGLRDVTFDDKLKEQDLYRFRGQVLSVNKPLDSSSPNMVTIPKEPNINPFLANKSFPPFTDGYLYNPAPSKNTPPTTPSIYDREEKYGLAPNIPKQTSGLTYEVTAPQTTADARGLSLDQQAALVGPQPYGTQPPVYQYPKTMLYGTTKGTVPDENKALDSESEYGSGSGSYLPWKSEGYTEDELRAKGHKFVGVYEFYDPNAKYWDKKNAKSDGMNRYAGFYVWNGKYYPINQPKAQYAISKGIGGLGEADFNNPYKTSRFYEGYSKDVENFIRNFGPENLWRYDPNWKNAGLKYSNPTTSPAPVWNTGNSGGSGRMQSDDPRNRGWYFNPAVNWAT